MNFDIVIFSSNPRKRQKRDSGSINEPEVAIKDFAKNLKDETDVTSQEAANMHHIEPKSEVSNDDDNGDDHDENSMGSKMDSKTPPNLNPGSFLGMAAAGLMDPSAAKGKYSQNPNLEFSQKKYVKMEGVLHCTGVTKKHQ